MDRLCRSSFVIGGHSWSKKHGRDVAEKLTASVVLSLKTTPQNVVGKRRLIVVNSCAVLLPAALSPFHTPANPEQTDKFDRPPEAASCRACSSIRARLEE